MTNHGIEFIKKNNLINLVIIGNGEDFKLLKNKINEYKINNNITLVGYKNNVFNYLHKCEAFILSSLWEDPGFVIVEAMYSNTFVLASDCKNYMKDCYGNEDLDISKEDFINKSRRVRKVFGEECKKYMLKNLLKSVK